MTIDYTELLVATGETIYMVAVAACVAVVCGFFLGLWAVLTAPGHLRPCPWVHRILGALVNVGRSIPYIILMVLAMPLTRAIVGTAVGLHASVVPLALAAIPFFARLVQMALSEVDAGILDMGRASGATSGQIVRHMLIAEARPALIGSATMTVVALVSYSAMAGAVGGGGLGDLAIRMGYQRFDMPTLLATTLIMVALVQACQSAGDAGVRHFAKRL